MTEQTMGELTLQNLKAYIFSRGQVSLRELALVFKESPDLIEGMLQHWLKKGKIEKALKTTACAKTCVRCPVDAFTLYAIKT